MKKILITGGAGFLGRYLIQNLLNNFDGLDITILDLRENKNKLFDFSNFTNIKYLYNKNICHYTDIENDFSGIDTVIHLAGLVSFSLKDKDRLQDINVTGAENVLKASFENNVLNFIHVSSVAALGYNNDPLNPINESFKFDWSIAKRKHKYYMLTKHEADEKVLEYRNKGMNIAIVYPGLMLGPGDRTNSTNLINGIKQGKIAFNMPGGTNIIDVRDTAKGIAQLLKHNIINDEILLSGENISFKEINKTIAEELGVNYPKKTLSKTLSSLLYYILLFAEFISKKPLPLTADNVDSASKFRYFSNTKANKVLSWRPEINFRDTIKNTIEWMVNKNEFKR
ncbi:MAG: NAD-dependent epimerase/dehydratase family protein [Elusimicrobiota bacterium]